jgi:hypothetical protein
MKMHPVSLSTYMCDVISTSAVSMHIGKPNFIMAFLNMHGSSAFFKSHLPNKPCTSFDRLVGIYSYPYHLS